MRLQSGNCGFIARDGIHGYSSAEANGARLCPPFQVSRECSRAGLPKCPPLLGGAGAAREAQRRRADRSWCRFWRLGVAACATELSRDEPSTRCEIPYPATFCPERRGAPRSDLCDNVSVVSGRTVGTWGVLVGVAGVAVAILAWQYPRPIPESAPVATVEVTVPALVTSAAAVGSSGEPAPVDASEPAVVPVTADLSSLAIQVQKADNGDGYKVGEDLYALGRHGTLALDVEWTLTDRNGSELRGEDCQVVVSVEGPGESLIRRFASCSGLTRGYFDGFPSGITVPGDWTVTVLDELSGREQSRAITVLASRDG